MYSKVIISAINFIISNNFIKIAKFSTILQQSKLNPIFL